MNRFSSKILHLKSKAKSNSETNVKERFDGQRIELSLESELKSVDIQVYNQFNICRQRA